MHYKFPKIEHLDQCRYIAEQDEHFVIKQNDEFGYSVIDYIFASNQAFPAVETEEDAIRREFRGLIFDKAGKVHSRRYHKFFNLGEREETLFENVEQKLNSTHYVRLEKLDGTMVTPLFFNDKLYWGTKMGITDTFTPLIGKFVSNCDEVRYSDFAYECRHNGWTPIFEYLSHLTDIQIVIRHPQENLVLTAIRNTVTGEYLADWIQFEICEDFNIPYNSPLQDSFNSFSDYIDFVKNLSGVEGVVIRFVDGHMIKMKCDEYVIMHKAKESIANEKNVWRIVIEDKVDDVIPILSDFDAKRIEMFKTQFDAKFFNNFNRLQGIFEKYRHLERKDFALAIFEENLPKIYEGVLFNKYSNPETDLINLFKNVLVSNTNNNNKLQRLKDAFELEFQATEKIE